MQGRLLVQSRLAANSILSFHTVSSYEHGHTAPMPTYVYRREDGSTFEVKQRITEDPLDTCPETGQDVERIITDNPGVIFKGEGFHVNDYDEHGPKHDGNGEKETGAESESEGS